VFSHIPGYWCSISGNADAISLFAPHLPSSSDRGSHPDLYLVDAGSHFPPVKLPGRTCNILRIWNRSMDLVIRYPEYLRCTPVSPDVCSAVKYPTAPSSCRIPIFIVPVVSTRVLTRYLLNIQKGPKKCIQLFRCHFLWLSCHSIRWLWHSCD
jgi:hypothetical protein